MIFGENLLALLVLAIGAALAVGNLMALLRPRQPGNSDDGDVYLERPPLGRSLVMIVLGTVFAIWAIASLTSAAPDEADELEATPAAASSADPPTGPSQDWGSAG